MLKYNNELRKNNVVYSIDKLIIDFEFMNGEDQVLLNWLSSNLNLNYNTWNVTKFANFKYQFSFVCDDEDNSFWLGVGFNGVHQYDIHKARLEFNPNKVFESYDLKLIFNKLVSLSSNFDLNRLDVAFDFPVMRENTYLIKDNRKYREDRRSYNDRTQYLGQHNNNGFVKLYNKEIESDLNYPLTRLEITLDYDKSSYSEFMKVMPTVKYLNDMQFTFDGFTLSDTDRYILITAYDNLDNLKMLGRRKYKKIECILDEYTQLLEIDKDTYLKLIQSLDMYKHSLPIDSLYNPFTGVTGLVSNLN